VNGERKNSGALSKSNSSSKLAVKADGEKSVRAGSVKASSPPVVILEKPTEQQQEQGFSFGFDLNPDLLAMSDPPSAGPTQSQSTNQELETKSTNHKCVQVELANHEPSVANGPTNEEATVSVSTNEKARFSESTPEEEDEDVYEDYDEDEEEEEEGWNHTPEINCTKRNFNYDVIVDFVNQAWDSVSTELVSGTKVMYFNLN